MRTIFDLISSHEETGNALTLVSRLLRSSDFDSRLGKKIYLNWLETVSKTQGLSEHSRADLLELNTSMEDNLLRLRLLQLSIDVAKRNSNLVFVESIAFVTLRDFTPLLMRGPSESDYATMKALIELMTLWIHHVKVRQKQDVISHRDFLIFSLIKLAFCLHYYPDHQIQPLLVDLLYITGRPGEIHFLFNAAGAKDLWLLFRSLTLKTITLPAESHESHLDPPTPVVFYDFVASRAMNLISSTVARQFGTRARAGADASFFDLSLLYRTVTQIEPASDLSLMARYIDKCALTPFESMVIYFGIVGRLIVGQEDEGAVQVLVNGVRNPDAQPLICKVLEYLSVQMMSYPRWSATRRGMIQSLFIRRLNVTPNKEFVKQLVLDNCPGAVKTFLGESIAKQALAAPKETATSAPIPESNSQLTQLLESIKRRRIE